MSKFIGVDYGSKRVGVAVSDDSGSLAFPYRVLSKTEALAHIGELWQSGDFSGIVIGKSLNFQREPNSIDRLAQEFGHALEKLGANVFFEDETFTSAQAVHDQGKTNGNDASAAALILQGFLDKKNNGLI